MSEEASSSYQNSGNPSTSSNYGSTSNSGMEKFAISEPYSQLGYDQNPPLNNRNETTSLWRRCCPKKRDSTPESDTMRIIVVSMFIFAAAVTVALIVQLISDIDPHPDRQSQTASDHFDCTRIGDEVMISGGNAVDAVVASSFCLAMVAPHITGIGGGGVMLIHKSQENKTVVIDFREAMPNIDNIRLYTDNPEAAKTGRYSIGIPGFVAGLNYAHQKYGSGNKLCCSWSHLIWKSVNISRSIVATQNLVNATQTKLGYLGDSEDTKYLREFLYDVNGSPFINDGTTLIDSPLYKNMIDVIENIATNGAEMFYQGDIAKQLVKELPGIISMEDLQAYQVKEANAIETFIGDYRIIAPSAPTSGPKLLAFMNAMEEYMIKSPGSSDNGVNYWANASEILEKLDIVQLNLGDPYSNNSKVSDEVSVLIDKQFIKKLLRKNDDVFGTNLLPFNDPTGAHAAAMDKNDVYVSVVTSLNTWFGSKFMTSQGILLNNALANFATPSEGERERAFTSANQMSYLHRPLTSYTVALAMNVKNICGQRVLVGGSTADSVGEVLVDSILYQHDLKGSISRGRLRALPDSLFVEDIFMEFTPQLINSLRQQTQSNISFSEVPYTTVNGIDKFVDTVLVVEDLRSGGHKISGGGGGIQRESRLEG